MRPQDEPEGMVDTAAGQALVGKKQLTTLIDKYRERGWNIPFREVKHVGTAKGVGGSSKVIGEAMVPVTKGGIRCLILFKVIAEDVPLLLPARWLESLGAVVDLEKDTLTVSMAGRRT
eukprot:3053003-Pyramimonas_sp.AAC.1